MKISSSLQIAQQILINMACEAKHFISFIIVTLPMFILHLLAFLWIRKLKTFHSGDCVCAEDWRLKFLYGYLAFIVVWTVAFTVYRFGSGCEITRSFIKSPVYLTFIALMLVASVAFIVISLQYLSLLKKKQCQCALNTKGDEILRAVVYIKIISMAILLLILLIAAIFLFNLVRKLNSDKKNND